MAKRKRYRIETDVEQDEETGARTAVGYCIDTVLRGADDEETVCFVTRGHPTQKAARQRVEEHVEEHATGEPMREIGAHQLGLSQEQFEDRIAEVGDVDEED